MVGMSGSFLGGRMQSKENDVAPLGHMNHADFKIRVWQESQTVAMVRRRSALPLKHFIATPAKIFTTWDEYHASGKGIGDIINFIVENTQNIITEFLPELTAHDAKCVFELEFSPAHTGITPPLVLFCIGHRDLFGPDGLVRDITEHSLKPDILVAEVRELWRRHQRHEDGAND